MQRGEKNSTLPGEEDTHKSKVGRILTKWDPPGST